MTKIFAFYLPQFHRTKENDEWWGEGFTEWTTVKHATALFEGHDQPRVPLEYYDLLNKSTMEHQAELMNRFGVDGMCFYHYYFENGRKVLEKPAENLLQWKDINMPFCFYWANESWARTWTNLKNVNTWITETRTNEKYNGDGVLLRQAYGGKKHWREHIQYLIPFFEDARYIKRDGRPVFIIYKPEDIPCLKEMIDYWNGLLDAQGIPHLFLIGKDTYSSVLDGCLSNEPPIQSYKTGNYENRFGIKQMLDYDDVWKQIINKPLVGKCYFCGGFVGYDDTPRRGNSGTVILGQSPAKFKNYMIALLTKAYHANSDMVFLNAWNEWGEGMYLEPDVESGTAYLQALKEAKDFVNENSEILAFLIDNVRCEDSGATEEIRQLKKKNIQYSGYWVALSEWLNVVEDGKTIVKYLWDNGIENVAIYGMGMLGTPLYKELTNNNINVMYGIDQDSTKGNKFDIPVYRLTDKLAEIDLIIVTVDYAYESIKKKLLEKGNFNIISLKELIEYAMQ